jgi:hypothetical protein
MGKSSGAFAILILCGLLALQLPARHAFAQAGSAGGTVGKTNKSASGGDDEPEHRDKPRAAKRASAGAREEAGFSASGDGTWVVSASGRCIPPWQITWLTSNGAISGSGTTGHISRGGGASGNVLFLGMKFDFVGHFSARSGAGTFVGPDGCPGQWSATRS